MPFPSEQLVATGGSCYGFLFENEHTGLPRNLFWNFRLDCAPIRYSDEEWDPSLALEWVVFQVSDWRELIPHSRSGSYGDDGVEASFYVFTHSAGDTFSLRITDWRSESSPEGGGVPRVLLKIAIEMSVDFPGYDGDEHPALPISAAAWVHFEGLIVSRDNFFPKPESIAEVRSMLEPFIDTTQFDPPASGGRFWTPRVKR